MKRVPAFLVVLAVLAGLMASCSAGGTGGPAAQPPAAATQPSGSTSQSAQAAVSIKGFAFSPAALTVAVGTTVTWTNMDSASHTVVSDAGDWKSGNLANGATFSQTFDKAGTFAYHCGIHPNMKATVTVQ